MPITDDLFTAARRAVAETTDRFAALVAASDPRAMATKDWTVADTLAHVSGIASRYTDHVRSQEQAVPELSSRTPVTTVDTVHVLNKQMLAMDPDRDPTTLLDRLRTDVDDIVRATEGLDPTTPLPWLGSAIVPRAGLLGHLINELQIHGYDIARATKQPWPVPPGDAALFFEAFFVGMLGHDTGHLLDNDEPPRHRRIAVAFRSHHTTPVTLVLHKGKVTAEPPGDPVDAHIFFDPPTFNLMMFHRISKPRAALTGKVRVWGRRPWLLPTFLKTVRCP